MNKAQFVELAQANGNYKTKVDAENAIKAFTDAVTQILVAKDDIALVGFGTFAIFLQKGKSGKIPNTNHTYTTEDKIVPKFSATKTLKDKVKG